MAHINIDNGNRLTDDLERRLVREMANGGGASKRGARRGLRRAASILGGVIHEVSSGMGKIGEARYS